MGKYLDQLVSLYAKSVAEVDSEHSSVLIDFFGADRYEELINDRTFAREKDSVRILAEELDDLELHLLDEREQVIKILKHLLGKSLYTKKDKDWIRREMKIRDQLIRKRYYPDWDEKERSHYDFLYPKVITWNLLFFSYTNHRAPIWNSRYKDVIDVYKNDLKFQSRSEKINECNLIAQIIVEVLRVNNVRRLFIDKRGINTGDIFETKIKDACQQSFLFVQLVTTDSFTYSDENWSYKEYQMFIDKNKELVGQHKAYKPVLDKRVRFALAEVENDDPISQIEVVPDPYKSWYDDIKRRHYCIAHVEKEQFEKGIKALAGEVFKYIKEDLIPGVPA